MSVIDIYHTDLLKAYDSRELLSHRSKFNIVKNANVNQLKASCAKHLYLLCSVSEDDIWETYVGKAWDGNVWLSKQQMGEKYNISCELSIRVNNSKPTYKN